MHPGQQPPEQPGPEQQRPEPPHPEQPEFGQFGPAQPSIGSASEAPPPYPGSAPGPAYQSPQPPPAYATYPYPQQTGHPQQESYGHPAGYEQGAYGQPAPPYGYGPPYNYGTPPQRSGGGKKAVLITLVVLVVLGLLTAGGFGVYALLSHDKASTSRSSAGKGYDNLGNPGDLSDKDLKKVDRRKLFFQTVRNMMLQSKVRTKSETMHSNKADFSEGFKAKNDVEFDYQTKKLSSINELNLSQSRTSASKSRCDNGKSYFYSTFEKKWTDDPFSGCKLTSAMSTIGDALNIFGLNEEQTDKVMSYFTDDFPNFIQVKELGLQTGPGSKGKKYLRFVVDYTPIPSGQYGYLGLQHFVFAFKKANILYSEHPYSPKGTGAQGLHVVYYVDPVTGLPVYSQQSNIPAFDSNGKPKSVEESNTSYRDDRYQYSFGELPALNLDGNAEITLDWPRDKDAGWKPPSS